MKDKMAALELDVLKIIKFDVGRVRSVQMLEQCSEILMIISEVVPMPVGKISFCFLALVFLFERFHVCLLLNFRCR